MELIAILFFSAIYLLITITVVTITTAWASRKKRRPWLWGNQGQEDFNRHIDCIHWNPVKHGYVKKVVDWPYSSFHQYLKQGIYSNDLGGNEQYEIQGIECRERYASLRRQHPIGASYGLISAPYRVLTEIYMNLNNAIETEFNFTLTPVIHEINTRNTK